MTTTDYLAQYRWNRQHGLCGRCGHRTRNRPKKPGGAVCGDCLAYAERYRERNHEHLSLLRSAREKENLNGRHAQGLCTRCGKEPSSPGYRMGEACRRYYRQRKSNARAQRVPLEPSTRSEAMTEQATKRKSGVRFIDPKTEKELEVQFIYQRSERMVHAILHDAENRPAPGGWLAVLATGVALCSKHDQFVKRKGRAIALARLIESGYPNDRAARKAIWKQILDGGFRVA